ncbi:MAG: helix-turn-helix domain-containing protein [Vicinamibacteria bacterium]|nr:helix-turn-helix domain-containing protein [Vicinamibacteria bacterium]
MTIAELRRIRMAKGLSLTEISRRTRIGVGFLRNIEEGNLRRLPPGFYARAFVRAYAEAIGIDADVVLGTLADELPAAQAALAPHPGGPQTGTPSPQTDSAALIPDARMHLLKQILDRHNTLVNKTIGRSSLVALGASVKPTRRVLSAAIDGLLLASLYLAFLAITAFSCGVTVPQLISVSAFAVFTVLALITLLYVFMMGGIAGRTIGSMFLDVPLVEQPAAPLNLHAIMRRSLRFVRADAAAAAEVVSLVAPLFNRARRAA